MPPMVRADCTQIEAAGEGLGFRSKSRWEARKASPPKTKKKILSEFRTSFGILFSMKRKTFCACVIQIQY